MIAHMTDPNNTQDELSRYLRPARVFGMTASLQMKAQPQSKLRSLTLDYRSELIGKSYILHADAFEWLSRIPENSLHAIVTDPPYGVKSTILIRLKSARMATAASGAYRRRLTVTLAHRCRASRL